MVILMLKQNENSLPSHVAMVLFSPLKLLARILICACSHQDECQVAASPIYCHSLSKVGETHLQVITGPGYCFGRGVVLALIIYT